MHGTPRPDGQSRGEERSEEVVGPDVDAVQGAGWLARLYASKAAHRLLPAPVALAIAGSIGPAARQRRNPAERRDAERFMRDLLLHTPRVNEAETLAEEWLKEKSRVRELFWRPWLLKHSRVSGLENWHAARAGGRGCVVVFGHLVAGWAPAAILTLHGFDLHVVASPHYWDALPSGYDGLRLLHRRREYGEKIFDPTRVIRADSDPMRLIELVQAGESVAIAFDVPGWAATPFLGRNVALGGGPATVAFKTEAKVLPVIPERHGARLDLRILTPVDPADHRDLRSLRIAVAQVFESLVLNRPEIVELPWNPSPLVNEVPPPRGMLAPEALP